MIFPLEPSIVIKVCDQEYSFLKRENSKLKKSYFLENKISDRRKINFIEILLAD
ncbi:hypothetical protein AsAng_0064400 (plasmid) [Aureispira anguillae]|uniref:Uncharacterized protein n=1 Tax=Aureispira anguillae TaxID=2864201 RepID=A0A916DY43_9BACT|nr:hypothetical protein AsAng_0064400 [Aureispira anguillae]